MIHSSANRNILGREHLENEFSRTHSSPFPLYPKSPLEKLPSLCSGSSPLTIPNTYSKIIMPASLRSACCSPSPRNAVRLASGISVQLHRNTQFLGTDLLTAFATGRPRLLRENSHLLPFDVAPEMQCNARQSNTKGYLGQLGALPIMIVGGDTGRREDLISMVGCAPAALQPSAVPPERQPDPRLHIAEKLQEFSILRCA